MEPSRDSRKDNDLVAVAVAVAVAPVRFHRAAGEGPGQRLGLEFAGLQATEPQLKKRKGHFAKLLKKASVIARFNPLYGMCSVGRLASCLESSTLERCWLLCAVLRDKSGNGVGSCPSLDERSLRLFSLGLAGIKSFPWIQVTNTKG